MRVESELTAKARKAMQEAFPHAKIYKHKDAATHGMPDTSITWHAATTWIEFKRLDAKLRTVVRALRANQLAELVKLERAGQRAWVVAYDLHTATTHLYRPSMLIGVTPDTLVIPLPSREVLPTLLEHLWRDGVVVCPGISHHPLLTLIAHTHTRDWPRRL